MNASVVHQMDAAELTRMILEREPLFILDVRNEEVFNNWKIEGQSVEVINIPYFDLLDGVDEFMDRIPQDMKVLIVCAKEGSSQFVAEMLASAGRSEVYYLAGGMKAWNEYLHPVKISDLQGGGALYQFLRIGKGCLSYLIISEGEAAVVDASRLTEVYESFARQAGARIIHALDTHLHADHISGGRKLAEKTGAVYWLPPKDADEVVFDYSGLEEGQTLTVGSARIQIKPVYSPGHTIGSTSLLIDGQFLLSGDILFMQSIGRPDLAGKAEDWVGDLYTTLHKTYNSLAEHLIVLPAHFGKIAELGDGGRVAAALPELFRSNPGLQVREESEFREMVTANLPEHPNAYQEIRQINMGKLQPTEEEQREMETGPNRCAVHDN
ncbi:MBL fold metallo-hydrolase [Paenibacillus tuaregi]|uniref:MBL fold metallo-hydrolase n=1 Tax=Paenibacillus tuaregi TaxID=1816681 RepID=UPI000838529E|nr:MBL fold metallo-hydrolase [Paenibacillus tuaregi]